MNDDEFSPGRRAYDERLERLARGLDADERAEAWATEPPGVRAAWEAYARAAARAPKRPPPADPREPDWQ
jgi:hypothetical protein